MDRVRTGLAWLTAREEWLWFAVALAVRLTAMAAIHWYSLAAGYGGFYPLQSGHDDHNYWVQAVNLHNNWGTDAELPNVYPRVLASLFFLSGPSLIAGKLLNVLAGSLAVWLGVLLVKRITGAASNSHASKACHWAGFLSAFYPSAVWYSTQLVKDPILVLTGMLVVYCLVSLMLNLRANGLVWMASYGAALGALYFFRPYMAIGLSGVAIGMFILHARQWLIPMILVSGVVPLITGWGWFGVGYFMPFLNPDSVSVLRDDVYAIGGSSLGIQLDFSNLVGFVGTYGYSLVSALLGPFPWQVHAPVHLLAILEAALMWILVLLSLSRLRCWLAQLHTPGFLVGLSAFVLIGLIAVFSDNLGANTRLRMLPWTLIVILVSSILPYTRAQVVVERLFKRSPRSFESPNVLV